MIRNESTSQLIASKNGDRDELLKLASRLMDRFLKDIIPAIAGAVNNSSLPAGVIEMAITSELYLRASLEQVRKGDSDKEVFDIWCLEKGNQKEMLEVVEKLAELRK